MSDVHLKHQATPAVPAAGESKFFFAADGTPSVVDELGYVMSLAGIGEVAYEYVCGLEADASYNVIQDAIDDAATAAVAAAYPKPVFIRPAEYTEDLTLKPGVILVGGTTEDAQGGTVKAPVILGNHSFDITGQHDFKAKGLVFTEADTTTPILTLSGVGSGGNSSFDDCVFAQSVPCTAAVLDLDSTDDVAEDGVFFRNCVFAGNTSAKAFQFDGSEVVYGFDGCRFENEADADEGINFVHTHGAAPGSMEFLGGDVACQVILDSNGVDILAEKTAFSNDSGVGPSIDVGNTSSFKCIGGIVGAVADPCIIGQGTVDLTSTPTTGDIQSSLTLKYTEGKLPSLQVKGHVEDIDVGPGPTTIHPLATFIRVLTATIAGPSTVDLGTPIDRGGDVIVVYDAEGDAASGPANVTITCTAASIVGTALLSKDYQRLTFVSDGAAWVQTADES